MKMKIKKDRFIRLEATNYNMLRYLKENGYRTYILVILKDGVPLDDITDSYGYVKSVFAIDRLGEKSNNVGFSKKYDIITKPTVNDYLEMAQKLKKG